ncbi:hypothetical protein PG988_006213 [Apiospora saccharicola]
MSRRTGDPENRRTSPDLKVEAGIGDGQVWLVLSPLAHSAGQATKEAAASVPSKFDIGSNGHDNPNSFYLTMPGIVKQSVGGLIRAISSELV